MASNATKMTAADIQKPATTRSVRREVVTATTVEQRGCLSWAVRTRGETDRVDCRLGYASSRELLATVSGRACGGLSSRSACKTTARTHNIPPA